MTCEHQNFNVFAAVARLGDIKGFNVEIKIECRECKKPFQFLGLRPGLDLQGAMCSIDGLEARLAICPQDEKPNPLQRMMFGVNKFDG